MCGRTACALNKEAISYAIGCKDPKSGQHVRCEWFESNHSYEPHFNQTSGQCLAVLVSKKLMDNTCSDDSHRVLTSMRWGLRPHWIKSSDTSTQVKPIINCRVETIAEKTTFKSALKSGRRCLVLVNGFFEWKTNKDNTKDPFFVYFKQTNVEFKSGNKEWIEKQSNLFQDNQWKGPRLLTIAGIFNRSDDNLLTFSVITVPSHPSLQWLHNRMPAVLDTEEAINDWLDFERVSVDKALHHLVPFGELEYHSVSRFVSNARNNSIETISPLKSNRKQKTIDHWFKPKVSDKSEEQTIKVEKDCFEVKKCKQIE